jgi:hypothetical protein
MGDLSKLCVRERGQAINAFAAVSATDSAPFGNTETVTVGLSPPSQVRNSVARRKRNCQTTHAQARKHRVSRKTECVCASDQKRGGAHSSD